MPYHSLTCRQFYKFFQKVFPENGVISNDLKLRHYQIDCIQRFFEFYKNIESNDLKYHSHVIKADPGLGKTYMALVIAKIFSLAFDYPIYVITPASTIDHWIKSSRVLNLENKIIFQSWGSIKNHSSFCRFITIVDECHYAQDYKSQRTVAALSLADNAFNMATIMLSATPVKNGKPQNLYPLFRMARMPIAQDRENYYIIYCGATYQDFYNKSGQLVKVLKPGKTFRNHDTLKRYVKGLFLVYNRDECLPDLPEKERILYEVFLSKKQEHEYKQKCLELYMQWYINPEIAESMTLGLLQQMRSYNSLLKAEVSLELIFEILESQKALIVFTCFIGSANYLQTQISKRFKCKMISGSTDVKDRQPIIDEYQLGDLDCLVLTMGSCGVGLNIDRAEYEILIDRGYTAAETLQAEDRGYRMTTDHKIVVYWISHGRIDEIIDKYNEHKLEYSSDIFDSNEIIDYCDIMKLCGNDFDPQTIEVKATEIKGN